MAITKEELKEIVEELKSKKGRHTEFITVYVPEGYDINSVQKQLEAEKSTAKNIKTTGTRKNVIDSLDKIVRELKGIKFTPKNGLGIFCGNVSEVEGQDDLQIWLVEPPQPLKTRLYRCDKEFVLEPLEVMLEADEVFGLLVMDRKEATIGLLEGKRIEVIQKMTSGIPSKVRAGGQCLSPDTLVFEKNKGPIKIKEIEEGDKIRAYDFINNTINFKKVNKKWNSIKDKLYEIFPRKAGNILSSEDHLFFVIDNKNSIIEKETKELTKENNLLYEDGSKSSITKIKITNGKFDLIDLEVEGGNFIANEHVVHNSSQRFHRITEGLTKDFYKRVAEEMKSAFFENPKLKGIVVGGPVPTKDEFLDGEYLTTQLAEKVIGRIDIGDTSESGLYELVEKSEELLAQQELMKEKNLLDKFFKMLGENPALVRYEEAEIRKAIQYGAVETLIISENADREISKELKKMAEEISSKVENVTTETEEGQQFVSITKKGIGAILRFGI